MAKKSQAEFVKWFGPLLDALRDLGDSGRPREVSDRIAKNMNLSDQILDETLKSGGGYTGVRRSIPLNNKISGMGRRLLVGR
jgi:hypothetical protein